ncbi:MAG: tRNA epoxyqueuosine(34) reductase QueG [Rhodospirillales bacterium]
MTNAKDTIRDKALELGFDVVGFTSAIAEPQDAKALSRFLKQGYQGEMDWLARHTERRVDPQKLMPEARSVIVLGSNYGPKNDPLHTLSQRDHATISVYAQGEDYHNALKKRLKQLGRWMVETMSCDIKVFVDTAPVMERPLAARAGLGWQGKHTNLVSREFGSWLFLGEVFTTLDLPPDTPEVDHCGSCDACMRACPTDAIVEPNRLNPTLCISYLTIEHKSAIEPNLMTSMGNRIYGCDDCLAVCPWNKFAEPTHEAPYFPRAELQAPRLADLATLDDAEFRKIFAGSPIKRTGRDRFVRNVMIAIGNSGDPKLRPSAERGLNDSSPLVQEASAWALAQLEQSD